MKCYYMDGKKKDLDYFKLKLKNISVYGGPFLGWVWIMSIYEVSRMEYFSLITGLSLEDHIIWQEKHVTVQAFLEFSQDFNGIIK